MSASLYIAIILVIAIVAYMIEAVKELDQNEFHNGIRKAQVIDVREKLTMTTVTLMGLAIFL